MNDKPSLHKVNVIVRHQITRPSAPLPVQVRPIPPVVPKKSMQIINRPPVVVQMPNQAAVRSTQRISVGYDNLRRMRSQYSERNRTVMEATVAGIDQLRGVGRGRILVIVACGPSINEAPLERLKGVDNLDVMSINKPDARLWPTKWWAFCDHSQYNRNQDKWSNEGVGVIISTSVRAKPRKNAVRVKSKPGKGFSTDLRVGYHIGRSSSYAAMQVARWMNYDKVFLFGVDMNPEGLNGKLHYYGDNPDVPPKSRKERFKYENESYQWAADNLSLEERNRYVFCSAYNPWQFVHLFGGGRKDHRTAVDDILAEVQKLKEKPK